MLRRSSGVLLPVSALPGQYGIGGFGKEAYAFIDFLVRTKQSYWQVLPLTTTSYGDSPYQSFSAVAGNTHLIDLGLLVDEGYLDAAVVANVSFGDQSDTIDYERIFYERRPLLEMAVRAFLADNSKRESFEQFYQDNASWLTDYAEFMAIKEHFGNRALQHWGDEQAIARVPERLQTLRAELAEVIEYHQVVQYFFMTQWLALKTYANQRGIKIIGDMPIYISADSVEVWTHPKLFKLDDAKRPLFVAGCPPDGFSEEGQFWGNPVYDWSYHAEEGYAWWIYRIAQSFKLYDLLRIDHFKGFSDYWEIAADQETGRYGSWQPGPGMALFQAVREALGELPIIAEDLGDIDDKTRQLLKESGYPGMKVLQFGFYDQRGQSVDIPHHFISHSIAYIGTHDNDVVTGWYAALEESQKAFVDAYINRKESESIGNAMLRTLFASVSQVVIWTMQDLLNKSSDARMNRPNTVGGNWKWRLLSEEMTPEQEAFLTTLTERYARER